MCLGSYVCCGARGAALLARPCPRHSTLAITYIQCFGCPCSALGIALESSGASALHSKCPRSCGTATEDRTGDQAARLAETPARIRLIAHYYRRSGSCGFTFSFFLFFDVLCSLSCGARGAALPARPCPRHSTLAITYIQCFGCPCSALGIALGANTLLKSSYSGPNKSS